MRGNGGADGAMVGVSDWTAKIARLEGELATARAELVARLVRRELRGEDPSLIDQTSSQLGRNNHIRAVRRRIEEAERRGIAPRELGAFKKGRRYLLTREAHAAELGQYTELPALAKAAAPPQDDPEQQLVAKLSRMRESRCQR